MGRSFYRLTPESAVEGFTQNNTYYHKASDQNFKMYARDGRYFQRRHQTGLDGRETNVVEKEIRFVLGSGNHARTYLSMTPTGQLQEVPVGWYAENGGHWGMNPGYDQADHMDFRRKIDQECFFCHNAYPEQAPGYSARGRELFLRGAVPEGIDCQRCHGPGRAHVANAEAGKPPAAIRDAIVNPARLNRDRQLEVCFQCHLESTSRRLPYAIRRYDRGLFSYRPGEPLQNYVLHFDHPQGHGYEDKFEISGAAYRLMKSACFLRSGALTCTTCHNPHQPPRGEAANRRYIEVCRSCHSTAHNVGQNCISCHMPKRRAEDAVHVVMTDHYIQRRRPSRDLLQPLQEARGSYQGEVAQLYPLEPPESEGELYLAVAQVTEGSNLKAGIQRLRKAIDTYRPREAEFYLELADACRKSDRSPEAISYYEEALRRKPHFVEAERNYAAALIQIGRLDAALRQLESAAATGPEDAVTLNALGEAYINAGRLDQAVSTLRRALRADDDLPEIYINLGATLSRLGDRTAAMEALRSAIRIRPDSSVAHNNLASVLDAQGDFPQAQDHFRWAIRVEPDYPAPHYNYGRALSAQKRLAEAESELRKALTLDPRFAEASTSLGMVLERKGQLAEAIEAYRRAILVKPDLAAARFNLALALARAGDRAEAKPQFESVIRSDPNDYQAHYHLGNILLSEGDYKSAAPHLRKASESPDLQLRNAALDALRHIR